MDAARMETSDDEGPHAPVHEDLSTAPSQNEPPKELRENQVDLPTRRSARIAHLANEPPTLAQIMRIEAEEAFTRTAWPRRNRHSGEGKREDEDEDGTDGHGSDTYRTRATTQDFRARFDPRISARNEPEQSAEEEEEEEAVQESDDDESVDGSVEERGEDVGDGGSRKRKRAERKVRVPHPQSIHDTWDDWKAYLAVYEKSTCQVLSVSYTTSVTNRNKRIKAQKTPQPLVPERLEVYERTYICTHGWKPKKSRGAKIRPRQHLRGKDCPLSFRVQYQLQDGVWRLVVIPGDAMHHNHRVARKEFMLLSNNRGVKDPETQALAETMIDQGINRTKLYDMLLERGENVFHTDVNNLVNRRVKETSLEEDRVATGKILDAYADANEGCALSSYQSPANMTGVINISTRHMRGMFERFGELLLVDCTHKTNKYNYQLCTFMVMDEFGHGQPVQQSLFETNADWNMERAIDHLIEANGDSWRLVRVIMVDKDMNEIKVLQARFPEARFIICHFHVLKYLSTVSRKVDFGKLAQHDYKRLDTICYELVYANEEDVYDKKYNELVEFCKRAKFENFIAYMDKNWQSTKDMWALYLRMKLPHFKNHTNNRLESWFGKFKEQVKPSSTMAVLVAELLAAALRCEREYAFRKRPGTVTNSTYDKEMALVLVFSTHFVAAAIKPEYDQALVKSSVYQFVQLEGNDDHFVEVITTRHTYKIDLIDSSCDCEFTLNMRLPCRHIMAYRKQIGTAPVIPMERIDERWRRETAALPDVPRIKRVHEDDIEASYEEEEQSIVRIAKLDARGRYKAAMRLAQKLCSELADVEDPHEFQEYLEQLQLHWQNIRQRRHISSPPMSPSRPPRAAPTRQAPSIDEPGGDDDPDDGLDPHSFAGSRRGRDEDLDEETKGGDTASPSSPTRTVQAALTGCRAAQDLAPGHDPDDGAAPASSVVRGGIREEDADEDMDDTPPTQVAELSQTNSLWCADIGHVDVQSPRTLVLPTPTAVLIAQDPVPTSGGPDDRDEPGQDQGVKDSAPAIHGPLVHGLTTSTIPPVVPTAQDPVVESCGIPDDGDESCEGEGASQRGRSVVHRSTRAARFEGNMDFNEDVKKLGRPRVDVKVVTTRVKEDRKKIQSSIAASTIHGMQTLDGLYKYIQNTQPGLIVLHELLKSVPVMYEECSRNKPKLVTLSSPVLVTHDLFRLPETLLEACLKLFIAEGKKKTTRVGSSPSASSSSAASDKTEVVRVNGAADFTKEQINLMRAFNRLHENLSQGVGFVVWLEEKVKPKLAASQQIPAQDLADKIRNSYPEALIQGLDATPVYVSAMYKLQPEEWLCFGAIRAFCERLRGAYLGVHHTNPDEVATHVPRAQRNRSSADEGFAFRVTVLSEQPGAQHIFVPVNISNMHWAGIMVNVKRKIIFAYDSLSKRGPSARVKKLVNAVHSKLESKGYSITILNSPMQKDGFSCGLFVMFRFWREADATVSKVMTDVHLDRRRFELLHFLMTGKKAT